MRYFLRDTTNKVKAIIYDRDVAETIKWLYVKDKWTMLPESPIKLKIATLQPTPLSNESRPSFPSEDEGVNAMREFDKFTAIPTPRKLAIHVSYTVKHNVRNYIARHPSFGTIRGATFDHDTAAHWFYQKIRSVWPAYVISKTT